MDVRSSSVSPVPEEMNSMGKSKPELISDDKAAMTLKTERKVSRFADKEKKGDVLENRFDDQEITECQGRSDSRLSNGIYHGRGAEADEGEEEDSAEEKSKLDLSSKRDANCVRTNRVNVRLNQRQYASDGEQELERNGERFAGIGGDGVESAEDGDDTREMEIRLSSTGAKYNDDVDEDDDENNKMETVDNMPLDLSVKSEIRDTYLMERRMASPASPGCRDSCTDSEDSDGPGGKTHGGKAYKKSLMKRYCKLQLFIKSHFFFLAGSREEKEKNFRGPEKSVWLWNFWQGLKSVSKCPLKIIEARFFLRFIGGPPLISPVVRIYFGNREPFTILRVGFSLSLCLYPCKKSIPLTYHYLGRDCLGQNKTY